MNAPPSASSIQELVMEMCSELFHTGRTIAGDRLYSAIGTTEMLYEKNLTCCETVNENRKGLPAEIKIVKEREHKSSVFFWKKDNPVMLVTCSPKRDKMCFL